MILNVVVCVAADVGNSLGFLCSVTIPRSVPVGAARPVVGMGKLRGGQTGAGTGLDPGLSPVFAPRSLPWVFSGPSGRGSTLY